MTNTVSTLVVSNEGNGWTITDNNQESVGGVYRNWVLAENEARSRATGEDILVVRLSAKDKRVVQFVKPRVDVSARTPGRSLGTLTQIVAPAPTNVDDVVAQVETGGYTENELRTMPGADLIALYNATTGNTASALKRGRFVDAILKAQG